MRNHLKRNFTKRHLSDEQTDISNFVYVLQFFLDARILFSASIDSRQKVLLSYNGIFTIVDLIQMYMTD